MNSPDFESSGFEPAALGTSSSYAAPLNGPNPFRPLEASIGQAGSGSQDKNREKTTPEMIQNFQAMMMDTRSSKRLDQLDNTKMHSNIGGHYTQTMNKGVEADQKRDDLHVAAKDLAQRLDSTGQQHLALTIDPNPNNRMGSGFFVQFGVEAAATAAVTVAMGPFAGAAVGAGMMAAAAMGKGSEATFNQTPTSFTLPSSSKHGTKHARNAEPGYVASESSPQQASATLPSSPMPESKKANDALSRGPSFGSCGRAELARQSLEGMLIKMADDSPAGKVATQMSEDSRRNRELHEQRAKNGGVDATLDNLAQANDAQLKQPGPKISNVAAPMLS